MSLRIELNQITLVYRDQDDATHTQPLSDVPTAGTLVDDSGEDLELAEALVTLAPGTQVVPVTSTDPRLEGWDNALPRAIAEMLTDREEPAADRIIDWLKENESSDVLWSAINKFVDGLEALAGIAPEGGSCDECAEPGTNSWPKLSPPVRLCDACLHDARRSGWDPGA